ncbi:hypothetical protein I583_00061 [Enterococcus haemoperoxidus ATCC BAA-382]|uniref:Peptidoglycan hydrolase n=3 Tax=Enterococcus haemoperoxidus ATCC BAA-382 TaxID=1158608 RepID=A0ABN0LDX3_9ENTE|nr:LysM peptidoglycan-binding domain-containing protein [Enterococcus haemoperoxidus]EOT63261.1 hypothetical protein I583_00061 [Enterococcus haemoperoxidus ATCC BAA-382]OJG54071.1 hypothetical protein RV06_GL000464 [Enterococcus haemoperoxidus]
MEKYKISRKERRKAEQNKMTSDQLKKGTTMLSSAIVVSSIAAPIVAPKIAEASEDKIPSEQVSYSDTNTHTEVVQTQTTATDSNNSMTQDTQSTAPETSSSEETSETQESSELNTSETAQSTEVTESTEESTEATDSSSTETEEPKTPDLSMRAAFSAQSRSVSPSTFIAEIAGHAQSVAAANDLYASVMMAQAILESDWGKSTLAAAPNHNLFGIKGSYQGQSVTMKTWEVINGQWIQVNAAFRKYPSFSESFGDNAYVLRNTSFQAGVYYYSGAWKSNTNSYRDATAWLTGRYATDPSYNTKLNNIITTYNLTQYDSPSSGGGNTGGNTGEGNTGGNTGGNNGGNTGGETSGQDVIHTVKAGDSLWALSAKYGTSIANIKNWNKLSGDVIYVGQKLIVKKGSGNTGGGNTGGNTGGSTGNTGGSGNAGTTNSYYTVKSGDSLWAIANANGISIANLRQWNNLNGDIIYPGQKLIVKKGSGNTGGGSAGGNTGGSTGNTGGSGNAGTTNSYYTVKSGDSLWAIANANGISIANLRQWNNLNSDIIYPGQKLIVKKGSGTTGGGNTGGNTGGSTGNTGGSNTGSTSSSYTVKSGDSLWAIANANGISVANLRQWNNLSGDIIYPGQKLIVKKGQGGSSGSSSSTGNQGGSQTAGLHTVKSGDTLWGLSQKYGSSVQKIKQMNGLSGDIIYIGQKLKVK